MKQLEPDKRAVANRVSLQKFMLCLAWLLISALIIGRFVSGNFVNLAFLIGSLLIFSVFRPGAEIYGDDNNKLKSVTYYAWAGVLLMAFFGFAYWLS